MKIKILSDSTCDLSSPILEKYDITLAPLYIIKNDQSFRDGVDITPEEIFRGVENGENICKTSALNISDYMNIFQKYTREYDAVLHINISNHFSSCHQNALIAAAEFDNVYVIDSLNLSTGSGLIVMDAARMAQDNSDIEMIVSNLKANVKKVEASFVIDTLKYLHMGGRCSSIASLGANLLKLKPCIEVIDGQMSVGKKYRGSYDNVIENYVMDRLKDRTDINYEKIFITHTGCSNQTIHIVIDTIKKYADFQEIIQTKAGCTISNHCGPNTLGILFERN